MWRTPCTVSRVWSVTRERAGVSFPSSLRESQTSRDEPHPSRSGSQIAGDAASAVIGRLAIYGYGVRTSAIYLLSLNLLPWLSPVLSPGLHILP